MPAVGEGVRVTRQRRRWTWTFFSAVLITVGALLAPVAILADSARVQLQSTDAFAATFAPLAHDPEVQTYLADQTTRVILKKVDVDPITGQRVIRTTVTKFMHSKAFVTIFDRTLRVTHLQMVETLRGSDDAVLSTTDGSLGIQLGPIVAAVRTYMLEQGIGVAAVIPHVHRTVVLVPESKLTPWRTAYGATVAGGTWLPVVVFLLLIGGVLLAKRRRIALIWAGAAVAATSLLVVIALDLAGVLVPHAVAGNVLPPAVVTAVVDQVTASPRNSAVVVAFAAVLVALAAWFGRANGVPARLRARGDAAMGSVRSAAATRGLTTGAFGIRLHSARRVIRYLIALVAALIVLLARPLTVGVILSTALVSLLALLLVELLQRPPASGSPQAVAETTSSAR